MPRKKKTAAKPQEETATETTSFVDESTETNVQTVEETKEKSNSAIPPIQLRRNEYGLLESVDYKYKEDGFVDWRAMVSQEYLYPNKDKTKETDVSKLRDDQLVIKLGGLKELAKIRGFKSVEFITDIPSPNYVCSTCKITWIPNYETEGREVVYSASSSAHYENVNSFLFPFLVEASTNRSFLRCVRNFLNIDIVAHEELFDKKSVQNQDYDKPTTNDAYAPLEIAMDKLGLTFEKLKVKCANAESYKFTNPESWNNIRDIKKNEVFVLLKILNDKIEEKK